MFINFVVPAVVFILLCTTITINSGDICDPRYGSQTKTTNECICMSRNCRGPQCERSQGELCTKVVSDLNQTKVSIVI